MTIDINGMAHVNFSVSRFEVYRKLLPEFETKPVFRRAATAPLVSVRRYRRHQRPYEPQQRLMLRVQRLTTQEISDLDL